MTSTGPAQPLPHRRVLLLGATGTIGRATAQALRARGWHVICPIRPMSTDSAHGLDGCERHALDVTYPEQLSRVLHPAASIAALVSCLASRSGAPQDAWAIDHQAHSRALQLAAQSGVRHMVLLSAICVQKPELEFQKAKLAFERELIASGLTYSIVRPTAFFKSLSGQIERVKKGRPFLVFGDGRLTACKPISDRDLGDFLAGCLDDPQRHNRVLPVGGPGPAITPLDQAACLSRLRGEPVRVKRVPVALLDAIVAVLSVAGRVWPAAAAKAELARIGRYYATESMLVRDPDTGRYDAQATPEWGQDTLWDSYARQWRGEITLQRGDHAVF